MRRIAYVSVCLIFGAVCLAAQSMGGVKGGIGYSGMHGETWDEWERERGYSNELSLSKTGGVFYSMQLSRSLYWQPELLYLQQTFLRFDGREELRTELNALECPLYLKMVFGESDKGRFYFMIGPEFKKYFGKVRLETRGSGGKESETLSVEDFYDRTDLWGAALETGAERITPYGIWSFGIKYSRGYTRPEEDGDLFPRKLMLQVGYAPFRGEAPR